MKNIIVILILIAILGLALYYIIRQKKKGVKCIGCPAEGCCPSKATKDCTCGSHNKDK